MSKDNQIKPSEKNLEKINSFLNQEMPPIITDFFTGITDLTSGIIKTIQKDGDFTGYLMLSRLAQRTISMGLRNAFYQEYNDIIKAGLTKDGYSKTRQGQYALLELLKFLDGDLEDEERFEILKKIFIIAATEKYSNRNDIKVLEYVYIAKELPSAATLTLIELYANTKSGKKQVSPKELSGALKLPYSLIDQYCSLLISKRLVLNASDVLAHNTVDATRINRMNDQCELTDLGIDFCEFISHYEDIKTEVSHQNKVESSK